MHSNSTIATKMQADKFLASRLEQALSGVKAQILEQAKNIQTGATRLAFFASCFTDNYQDVCARQKAEDIRFALNIVGLTHKGSVIERMVKIYVDFLLQNMTPERLQRIQRGLLRQGAHFASGSLTNQAFGAAVTFAICSSFGLSVSMDATLLKYSTLSVTIVGAYAYVQKAADAADRLRRQNGIYYHALYSEKLEMLYFLIEPVISRNPSLNRILSSDDEIADAIMRIVR